MKFQCFAVAALCAVALFTSQRNAYAQAHPEERLRAAGFGLPEFTAPTANFVRAKRVGNLVFLSGHGDCPDYTRGKLGTDRSVDEGYAAARGTALCLLASLKREIGDLDKVVQIVKVHGMVNATPDFEDHSTVMNGCSDLLVAAFGERGRHTRAAVGMGSLPGGLSVEIEMVAEVRD